MTGSCATGGGGGGDDAAGLAAFFAHSTLPGKLTSANRQHNIGNRSLIRE